MPRPASPCWKALRREASLPSSVFGPVDFWALRRFAAICFSVAIGGSPHEFSTDVGKRPATRAGRRQTLSRRGTVSFCRARICRAGFNLPSPYQRSAG